MSVDGDVERIYETERDNIFSWLVDSGIAPPRAQEVVQDSFLKLYLKMKKGERIENPRAWLYRVARNLSLRIYTREPLWQELDRSPEPAESSSNPEAELLAKQRNSALRSALSSLSPQQRQCLDLRVRGLRYREIAEVIGISTSAVGEFLRRAIVRLKEALDGA